MPKSSNNTTSDSMSDSTIDSTSDMDLENLMDIEYVYPSPSDPEFQNKIFTKREFYYHKISGRDELQTDDENAEFFQLMGEDSFEKFISYGVKPTLLPLNLIVNPREAQTSVIRLLNQTPVFQLRYDQYFSTSSSSIRKKYSQNETSELVSNIVDHNVRKWGLYGAQNIQTSTCAQVLSSTELKKK